MRINDITRTIYRVKDFFDWQKNGKLELSPSFQRRQVWKPSAKSFLVDSIARNFPIPPILLRERIEGLQELESKLEVVDGQQRLRTILSFVDPKLFSDYSEKEDGFTVLPYHNQEISGKKFSALPPEIRRQILDYQVIVHVLPSNTDDREILEIFSRINSTGIRLNNQELRNADYFGEFKTSMYILAAEQLTRWRNWGVFSESRIARMDEVQLTSELVMMMLQGLTSQSQKILDGLYEEHEDKFPGRSEVEKRFRNVMDEIEKKVGGALLDKEAFQGRILFYVLFGAFYHKLYGMKSQIKKGKTPGKITSAWVASLLKKEKAIRDDKAPDAVLKSLTGGTNSLENRTVLYDYFISA